MIDLAFEPERTTRMSVASMRATARPDVPELLSRARDIATFVQARARQTEADRRISDDVIEGVSSKHPFVRVDWKELKEKAGHELVQPFQNDAQHLKDLLASVRNLHFDIADLHLPVLEMTQDRELTAQLVSGLKLLRGTLDVKLAQLRKGGAPSYQH